MAAKELFTTSLYSDANLVAYYRCEDNFNDVKNSNNLSGSGSPTFVTGKFGKGGNFVGTSSQFASGSLTAPTGAFSITAWVNPTVINYTGSFGCFGNAGGTDTTGICFGSSNRFQLCKNRTEFISEATISTGVWTFVAGIYTGSAVKVWVNDVKKETADTTNPSTTANFNIGRFGQYAEYLTNCIIDEVAYFNRALTDAEVLSLYTGPATSSGGGSFLINFL